MGYSYISLIPNKTAGFTLPEDSHMTLIFMDETKWEATVNSIHVIVPMLKHINLLYMTGFARFRTPKNDALVALIEPDYLMKEFREQLLKLLLEHKVSVQRASFWVPHITLGYVEHNEKTEALSIYGTIEFDKLRFKEKETGRIEEWKIK